MVSVPAVERRRDVHRTVHEGCVQGNGQRKVSKRNVAKREREREWIKCSGGQASQECQRNHQTVTVQQRQKDKQHGEERGGCEQDPPWSHQTAEIYGERANKHQAKV